jgi:hypothetical protein
MASVLDFAFLCHLELLEILDKCSHAWRVLKCCFTLCSSPLHTFHIDLSLQVEKVLQLHVACEQRMGVILMGAAGSGKTTVWSCLADAYAALGNPPIIRKVNPKAMPRQQLLGSMDPQTRCDSALKF